MGKPWFPSLSLGLSFVSSTYRMGLQGCFSGVLRAVRFTNIVTSLPGTQLWALKGTRMLEAGWGGCEMWATPSSRSPRSVRAPTWSFLLGSAEVPACREAEPGLGGPQGALEPCCDHPNPRVRHLWAQRQSVCLLTKIRGRPAVGSPGSCWEWGEGLGLVSTPVKRAAQSQERSWLLLML